MNQFSLMAFAVVAMMLPAAFILFVISTTRRGGEFGKLDGFYKSIDHFRVRLHEAFAEDRRKAEDNRKTPKAAQE